MGFVQLLKEAVDAATVRRVFGEPYTRGEVTVIPVAAIRGGGGGGGGHDASGQDGEGGGFGFVARPAGVYLVTDDGVRWRPAVDVDRLVGAAVAVSGIIAATWLKLASMRAREGRSRGLLRGPRARR